MTSALVIGGTGFIGRRLVRGLLKEGCEVTVASSGKSPNPFGDMVKSYRINRFDSSRLKTQISGADDFDVAFDQICFSYYEAESLAQALDGKTERLVMVSSGAVYHPTQGIHVESDFDPLSRKLNKESYSTQNYSEGKKDAEAYMFQRAPFRVAAARFPMVFGHDDSSRRSQEHVSGVINGNEFTIPAEGGRRNYIWVEDAGSFLCWLGLDRKEGIYNAGSREAVNVVELLETIGKIVEKSPLISISPDATDMPSFYREDDHIVDARKAEDEGFRFTPLKKWLKEEVNLIRKDGGEPLNLDDYYSNRTS